MAEYELVREIPNLCRNNQMRDVFVSEIECDDPVEYVRNFIKSELKSLTSEVKSDGTIVVYAETPGLFEKFSFTPL